MHVRVPSQPAVRLRLVRGQVVQDHVNLLAQVAAPRHGSHRSLVLLEFNTWCQVGLSGVHPKKFADWTLSQFTMSMRSVATVATTIWSVSQRMVQGPSCTNMVHDALITDLVVTNYEESLLPSWHGLRSKLKVIVAERDRAVAERDGALAEKKNGKLPVDLGSWHATGRWFASLTAARIRERRYRR